MYVVVPGGVVSINTAPTTTEPSGIRLGTVYSLYESEGATAPVEGNPDEAALLDMFSYSTYRGAIGDYFEIVFHDASDEETSYYYAVTSTGPKSWSDAILITGGVPLASDTQVGGFYNASTDAEYTDAGYVYLDETGHLRLVDYALLRSGALAYQLGSDFRIPSNSTLEYIQDTLNEYVNDRVAFRTGAIPTTTPEMIHIYISLPEEEGIISLHNIDSRFGTGVYVHFLADDKSKDYSNIVINVTDCEKIRIDNSLTTLTNAPIINIFRSCLYYDAELINYIRICDPDHKRDTLFPAYTNFTGFENLTLWYARFTTSDPDLIVNGMEISQPNVAMTTQEISFWTETVADDVHYNYALRSITLSGSGQIIGCSMYLSNNTSKTAPVDLVNHIIIGGDFTLPQGSSLNYPVACINSPLQVTGTFTTAYLPVDSDAWIVIETSFTARTGVYSTNTGVTNGSIAFNSKTDTVKTTYTNVDRIDGWAPESYHIFYGGTTV